MKSVKDERWVFNKDIDYEACGNGADGAVAVERKILAYCDRLMCVENHFKTGGVGKLHSHPHTQLTYVAEGKFEFQIGDEKKIVSKGDTLLKQDGVKHGCVCLEEGILIDIFTPMRDEFV